MAVEFFNGLGKKFSHAARTVTELTKEGVENTRLTADLRSARSELDRRLADLGRAYYEFVRGKTDAVDGTLIDDVHESMEQVHALIAQREVLRRQCRCPGCGSVQSIDARFCSGCGHAMPEKAPEPRSEEPGDEEYCEECGAMRQNNSKYCAICGHGFGEEETLPAELPKPAAEEKPLEEPEYPYDE